MSNCKKTIISKNIAEKGSQPCKLTRAMKLKKVYCDTGLGKGFEEQLVAQIIKDYNIKKETLLMQKILEVNPHFSMEQEMKERLNRIQIVRIGDEENFFYDTGSKKIRLITFVNTKIDISGGTVDYKLNYY